MAAAAPPPLGAVHSTRSGPPFPAPAGLSCGTPLPYAVCGTRPWLSAAALPHRRAPPERLRSPGPRGTAPPRAASTLRSAAARHHAFCRRVPPAGRSPLAPRAARRSAASRPQPTPSATQPRPAVPADWQPAQAARRTGLPTPLATLSPRRASRAAPSGGPPAGRAGPAGVGEPRPHRGKAAQRPLQHNTTPRRPADAHTAQHFPLPPQHNQRERTPRRVCCLYFSGAPPPATQPPAGCPRRPRRPVPPPARQPPRAPARLRPLRSRPPVAAPAGANSTPHFPLLLAPLPLAALSRCPTPACPQNTHTARGAASRPSACRCPVPLMPGPAARPGAPAETSIRFCTTARRKKMRRHTLADTPPARPRPRGSC